MYSRSHNCGELRKSDNTKEVFLNGWVDKVRLHGKIVFIDLRDRYGKTQIVFDLDHFHGVFDEVKKLSMEDVLSIKGKVRFRADIAVNSKIKILSAWAKLKVIRITVKKDIILSMILL